MIWLDPETGLQVGREYAERDPESGELQLRVVSQDFEYDAAPPEGIFDLPTPEQALAFAQPDAEALDLRRTLPANVIRAIERAIERSNRAWSAGDFERFDKVWSYLPLPDDREQTSRAQWEEAIRNQTESTTWVSAIRSITRSDHVPMPVTPTIHQPVPCPGTYCIRARLQLEWPDGQIWVGNADYFVQERDGEYRLLHWTYPSEEIRNARARSQAA